MLAKSTHDGSMSRACLLGIAILGVSLPAFAGSGGWIEFQNETTTRLVASPDLSTSDSNEKDYAWGDVDHDGDLDVVCVRKQGWTTPGRRRNVLFMNEGLAEGHATNGVLVDRTTDYAVDASDGGQGFLDLTNDRDAVLADLNGDGWLDLATATTLSDGLPKTISHPRIYINKGAPEGTWLGFRYEESFFPQIMTISNPHPVAPRFCSVAAGDIDGDGDNDLYFGDYDSAGSGGSTPEAPGDDVNDRLFLNDGTGRFTDSLETRLSNSMLLSAFSMASIIIDMNSDGLLDIVKDTALNFPQRVSVAYNNPANPGHFNALDIVYDFAPYHTVVGDLNNDNRPDMVVTDDGADRYLINTGNGVDGRADFTNRTFSFSGGGGDDGFGGDNFIVDLNNDGFNDVLITDVDVDIEGCNRRLHIYRNLGDVPVVTLQEQGGAAPWTPAGVHDLAVFDLNGDGWNDMLIGTCMGTQVWINQPPIGLRFTYPAGLPGLIPPNAGLTFQVHLTGFGTGVPLPNSAVLHVALDEGAFTDIQLTPIGDDLYEGTFPPNQCAHTYRWYISGVVESGEQFFDPAAGPVGPYISTAALGTAITLRDEIEGDVSGWTVVNENLSAGAWEAVDPIGTLWAGGTLAAPNDDASAAAEAVKAFVTMNAPPTQPSAGDVDGGPTYLVSPRVDLAGTDGVISYSQWFFCHNVGMPQADVMTIDVSNDDGNTWTQVRTVTSTGSQWEVDSFQVGDFVTPTAQVRVRFGVSDEPNNSLTEAGIDNFQVQAYICDEPISIVSSNPPPQAIDARQPSDPNGQNHSGWSYVELTFDGDVSNLDPLDFAVSVEPPGLAPQIGFVNLVGPNTVGLQFGDGVEEIFPIGHWTIITHTASGTAVRFGFLPGDVNADKTTSPVDVLALIDALNGVSLLPEYSTDVDRSGVTNPADILRVIDLLNGAGEYDVYNGATLP